MSLRARLTIFVTALTLALLGGLGLYLGGSLDAWSAEALDRDLSRQARQLEHSLEVERDGSLELEGDDDARGAPFVVETARGRVLLGRRAGPLLTMTSAPRASGAFETVTSDDGAPWRVLSLPVEPEHAERLPRAELPLVLRVAAPAAAVAALSERFRGGLLVALLLGGLFGAGGAFALATVVLAPLRRLSTEIATVDERHLERRVSTDGLAPELALVARAFNAVLERLQASFDRQRQLIARASHALRTPLAAVLSQAEVASRRQRGAEEYRQALLDIADSARESAGLVDGLLALSRADEAADASLREDVRVADVAAELARLFGDRAAEGGLSLHVDVPAGLAVRADRGRLREALEALVDNAVRYTPRGGQVGLTARPLDDGVAELEVYDSGVGLTDEDRAHVFERFYRGSAAEQTEQPGTGLGLALVAAIAGAHDAVVALEPRAGGGTRALLRWPRANV